MYPLKRVLFAVLLFGTAFGYLEAAVVSYLRDLHEPARQRYHPGRSPADLFPLLTLDQLRESGALQSRTLAIEVGREAATLIMLAAVALAVAKDAGQWAAAMAIAFGVWDITFYVFLKVLLDWPASLFTWDILFLIPVPWVGPVIAPCLVSAAMIGTGVYHLYRAAAGQPVQLGRRHWLGIYLAALAIIVTFAQDYRHIMGGGRPNAFNWWGFCAALGAGVLAYSLAAIRPSGGKQPQPQPAGRLAGRPG